MSNRAHLAYQATAGAYAVWALACLIVFGLGHMTALAVLGGAGITVFGLTTGTVVAVCRRRDHLRRRPASPATTTPLDTEQFIALMRAAGAGDLEHLGLD